MWHDDLWVNLVEFPFKNYVYNYYSSCVCIVDIVKMFRCQLPVKQCKTHNIN